MSFRAKLLIAFVTTVVLCVGGVAWTVSTATRSAFEERDAARTSALVGQFQREFARRGEEVLHRLQGIAEDENTLRMAIDLSRPTADASLYVGDATGLSRQHQMHFLEIVSDDGRIISSAHWPARFGYPNEWIKPEADWRNSPAFLKKEDTSSGPALALLGVRPVSVGEKRIYVAGGHRLDKEFLASLVMPEGMRALLYANLEPAFSSTALTDRNGPLDSPEKLAPLIEQVRHAPAPPAGRAESFEKTVQWTASPESAETFHALPLRGRGNELLGVLLVGSTRAEFIRLNRKITDTALAIGAAGILLGILLSWWVSARVTRPVKELAAGAREVASGHWNVHVKERGHDEVGELARAFNAMTRQLIEQRERLVSTERVAAWRELARRLAHELKNPLFPLQITVENLQRARQRSQAEFEEVFRESTGTLLAELDNLKAIVGRFSDFAKMPAPDLKSVDLNALVRYTVKLFDAQFSAPGRPPVISELYLEEGLGMIQADPDLIHRALQNLVLNAMDAMSAGGTLTIRTRRIAHGVQLEVADTGMGLTREECERLFTPYYTTKQFGTGLGLAIVQSVVSDHKGRIAVESEPGRGTTFRIALPARPDAVVLHPQKLPPAEKPAVQTVKPQPPPAQAVTPEPVTPASVSPLPEPALSPEPAPVGAGFSPASSSPDAVAPPELAPAREAFAAAAAQPSTPGPRPRSAPPPVPIEEITSVLESRIDSLGAPSASAPPTEPEEYARLIPSPEDAQPPPSPGALLEDTPSEEPEKKKPEPQKRFFFKWYK